MCVCVSKFNLTTLITPTTMPTMPTPTTGTTLTDRKSCPEPQLRILPEQNTVLLSLCASVRHRRYKWFDHVNHTFWRTWTYKTTGTDQTKENSGIHIQPVDLSVANFSQEFSSSVQGLGRSLVDETERNFESDCKGGWKSVFFFWGVEECSKTKESSGGAQSGFGQPAVAYRCNLISSPQVAPR